MKNFRDLYEELLSYTGSDLYQDVLLPFVPHAQDLLEPLQDLAQLRSSPPGTVSHDWLETLFALNVCNDRLLNTLNISQKEYLDFFARLGFDPIQRGEKYNPLLHEIVEVGNWPSKEKGISLGVCYWPGLRFGELIFSRCAVDVFCDSSYLRKGIADRSILHFTNWRMRRETHDCSHGWGSNSRWSTDFHRNYEVEDYLFLNVDGEHELTSEEGYSNETESELSLSQARELLFNRCLVTTKSEQKEFFPYNWSLTLTRQQDMWPIKPDMITSKQAALKELKIA